MKNLVGKMFSLAQGRYRIVDVQRLSGDAMVYAERVDASVTADGPLSPAMSPRAAFRYGDIVALLEAPRNVWAARPWRTGAALAETAPQKRAERLNTATAPGNWKRIATEALDGTFEMELEEIAEGLVALPDAAEDDLEGARASDPAPTWVDAYEF